MVILCRRQGSCNTQPLQSLHGGHNAGAGQFLNLLAFGALPLVPPLLGIILSHLAVLLVCSNRQRRPLHPGKLAICVEEAAIGRKQYPLPDVSGGQQLVVMRRG